MSGFLPNSDSALLAWSLNFKSLIISSPTAFGLTTALASAYGTLHDSYASALAACDPAIRTRGAVATKNTAKNALKANARLLADLVRGTASVTNAQKLALGLTVRSAGSPIPPPSDAPGLDVVSVSAWTVNIKLHDAAVAGKRGKPPGVSGASVFTFVGANPPVDISAWQFVGNTGKTKLSVPFPNTLAAGAKVWLAAFWFNPRKQSGPVCAPVGTNLPGGSVALAA
ncbi:MAG TPA: hypothetical protein VF669_00150 [Tepidisphaeraceae bacterium]|jgi:hypothetical protein